MGRAIDIVKVKAEIAAGKLAAIAENGNVLLKDMQSGEAGEGCGYQAAAENRLVCWLQRFLWS